MLIKNNLKFFISFIVKTVFLLLPFMVFAAPTAPASGTDYYGLGAAAGKTSLPSGGGDPGLAIAQFLGRFTGAALALSGSIFVFLIVYGGITILTSAGNQEKVTKGKNVIIWAIIGALILGAAWAITAAIFGIFTTTT